MYLFPVSDEQIEDDRILITDDKIILKTYGLPMIFWGYLAVSFAIIAFMWLAAAPIISKLLTYTDDFTLIFLAYLVRYSLLLTPFFLLTFFFYEKNITKKNSDLTLTHKIFFIPVWEKKYFLKKKDAFEVVHFMNSPNMARIRNSEQHSSQALRQFENKGYFELCITTTNDKTITIDRHSRKADLIKMKEILSKY